MGRVSDVIDHIAPDDSVGAKVTFETERESRYQRLSLLTLDLAEEAAQAALNFSHVEQHNKTGPWNARLPL